MGIQFFFFFVIRFPFLVPQETDRSLSVTVTPCNSRIDWNLMFIPQTKNNGTLKRKSNLKIVKKKKKGLKMMSQYMHTPSSPDPTGGITNLQRDKL